MFRGGAAIEALKGVKLGAGVVYVRATEQLSRATGFPGSMAEVGAAGGGWGWTVSTELKIPGAPLKFGGEYRSKTTAKLEGNAHFTNVPPPYQTLLQDQAATSDMIVPADLHLGLSWQASEHLEVMAGFTYEWWSAWKADTFVGDKGFTVTVPRNYNDAQIYRLGVEYARAPALKGFTLRAGMMRSISEQPTDTISPSLSDASSWNVSVGAGYEIKKGLSVDAAYQYSKFDSVTATGTEAFPGSYKTHVYIASLGIVWATGVGASR
jgi:long-chain fatty acid transport protein